MYTINNKNNYMSAESRKKNRIHRILDDAKEALAKENVKYFLAAVDRNEDNKETGGNVFAHSDVTGEDFTLILNIALPTPSDIVALGTWVGLILKARQDERKNVTEDGQ